MDALLSTLQRYRTLQPILHTLIAALSTNALTFVSVAIGRLREYEPKVEKAGKISGEARRQLYMTRSTQGGAAGAVSRAPFPPPRPLVLPPLPHYGLCRGASLTRSRRSSSP